IGGSVFWAGLSAVDGVDLLYAGSGGVEQSGRAVDFRLGVLKEWEGDRSLEALLLHNRYDMTHDVTYVDPFWDPGTLRTLWRPRIEQNLDHSNTWGLHLQYERPAGDSGLRLGLVATANLMSHPKLPNYQIVSVQTIPRDPGNSEAFNVGVGLSRSRGPASWGIEFMFEPIWSYTWADAAEPVATRDGGTVPVGGKTVENWFRFTNLQFRMGAGREFEIGGPGKTAGVQVGLMVHTIRYSLYQYNNVGLTDRSLREGWAEWAPTWGFSLRFPETEIRYQGRLTKGTGRPGVVAQFGGGNRGVASALESAGGSILVAPNGPLTLTNVDLFAHQISLSFPLR
ncbi:MAG: hypothetical protein HY560_13620, partial [Gemmatimonadetes bacterium]|nr:hypothetical protein [Gemmatimonadota bacterium]